MRSCELGREPLPPLVPDVHRGRRWLRACEEPTLGLEVPLHRPVEIEVILAQVREDERVESNSIEPSERRAVRRRLDRGALVSRVDHLAKETMQVDRLRRGERRGALLPADDPAHGPDQPRPASRRVEHRVKEEHRRGLPVRPGDSGQLECSARLPEEDVGRHGHRRAHVLDDELRNVDVEHTLHDECDRTLLDRFPGEIVAVHTRSRDTEEQRTLRHRAGVVREVADRDRPRSGHLARGERPDQGLELHVL